MKKSNSKKLYRFIRSHRSKDTRSSCDSIDSLTIAPSRPLLSTASSTYLPIFPSPPNDKLSHYRSQTYPDPTPLKQPLAQGLKTHQHTNSRSSMGNETVIIRQQSQSFPGHLVLGATSPKWSKDVSNLKGSLAKMKVSHQMRCYELFESTQKIKKQKQNLQIKTKILTDLLLEGKHAHIEFG